MALGWLGIVEEIEPDIIFTNKKSEEIAIEVETGFKSKFDSKKKYLDEKFSKLKKQYGNRCYIFLPVKDLKNSYMRYQLPLIFRFDISSFVELQFSDKQSITIGQKSNTAI